MKLVPVSLEDLELYESCFCDPDHMADLGGVQPREKVPLVFVSLATVSSDGCRFYLDSKHTGETGILYGV